MAKAEQTLVHIIREPEKRNGAGTPMLLLLHGFDGNEQNLMKFAPLMDGRFLVASARAPYALGSDTNCWFHVEFRPEGNVIVAEEAERSRVTILDFLDYMVASYGVDAGQVYLMGFSQGAIMSLSVGLSRPDRVAGVVAMSGRLLPEIEPLIASPDALRSLPVLVVHGVGDDTLSISYATAARDSLSALGMDVTYREYDMGHQITSQSLSDIAAWLSVRLDLHQPGSRPVSR